MIPIRDTIPSRSTPIVTWALIAVNTAVFFYEISLNSIELERLFYQFGFVPARYSHPDWAMLVGLSPHDYWPLLTSMFLHGGWLHLIGNMWALWIFGDNVEDQMGPMRYLSFYLLTGLAGGLAHWYMNVDSTMPTVGASGAIAGVLGAYFILFPYSRVIVLFPIFFIPFFFELPAGFYLLFWYLTQLFGGTLAGLTPGSVGGVAFWGHVGGFTSGVLLHRLFVIGRDRPRRFEQDESGIEGAWARRI